ncbi:MAG: AAA family ATPase, partial [bacterium]
MRSPAWTIPARLPDEPLRLLTTTGLVLLSRARREHRRHASPARRRDAGTPVAIGIRQEVRNRMEGQTLNGAVSGAGNAMVELGASPAPARGAEWAGRVHAEVQQAVVGQDIVIERALVALLADGHVLIEGMPGLAKTLLVKSLAAALGVDFERVQFTPDLLPADVVGTMVFQPQRGEFTTHKGPIFANLVLADEINRAPAKVQSALLEAMQERQVTIG